MRPKIVSPGGADGFTLFETIAALTVLSVALVALFQGQNAGLRSARSATDYNKARLIAESLLAEATSGWRNKLKNESGRTETYDWSISVTPANEGWSAIDAKTGWRLARVAVRISWDAKRSYQIDTLKLIKVKGS